MIAVPLKSQSLTHRQTLPTQAVIKRRQRAHSASFNGLGQLNLLAQDTAENLESKVIKCL